MTPKSPCQVGIIPLGTEAVNCRWAIERIDDGGQLTGQVIGQFDQLLEAVRECQRRHWTYKVCKWAVR